MEEQEYTAQKMSAALYEMARRNPRDENYWVEAALPWALSVPRKNPGGWKAKREEAEAITKNLNIDEDALLYGAYVMASKVISASFSRTLNDDATTFASKFQKNPDDMRLYIKNLEERASLKLISKI
jgi:hypothetical protein